MVTEKHYTLIHDIIKYQIKHIGDVAELAYDDLYQVGSIALMKAAKKYRPEQATFETYAETVIKNALLDYIRSINRYHKTHDKSHDSLYDSILATEPDHTTIYVSDFLERLKSNGQYKGTALKGLEAIRLRAEGLNNEEIAALFGVQKSCVSCWICRASKKIRRDKSFLSYLQN